MSDVIWGHNTEDPGIYEGAIGWRFIENDKVIVLYPMLFNLRICIGPKNSATYDRGWCYPRERQALAFAALIEWDGVDDPPEGWIKEVGTERRRP